MTNASPPQTLRTSAVVLVGCGEITEKNVDLLQAQEPAALMAESLRRAGRDAVGQRSRDLLASVDSLDVVAEHSWPYADACDLLTRRLEIRPARMSYAEAGGDSPVRLIHDAALRIQRGESTVAAIVGAEANHTVAAATKAGIDLPWSPRDRNAKLLRGADICHPIAVRHSMVQPLQVYPLYENAAQAAWRQTPAEAQHESSELWARYAAIAAENPYAWLKKRYSADEIATPSPSNRQVAWPYTKHMVANPLVNQGAGVLLMSLERAREFGIPESRCVYLWGGARATEPRDYLQRDRYDRSTAQEAVLRATLDIAGGDVSRFAHLELYSCFPIVPKMARRTLGLAADAPMTSTGGLSFFGAPLSNYMTHATAALMRRLRERPGQLALLYGQGEYVTKHHALVLGSTPSSKPLPGDYSVQARADRERDAAPELILEYAGPATVETFTIAYDREGMPAFGTVIARTRDGARTMARVHAHERATLEILSDLSASAVGRKGVVRSAADGFLTWTLT